MRRDTVILAVNINTLIIYHGVFQLQVEILVKIARHCSDLYADRKTKQLHRQSDSQLDPTLSVFHRLLQSGDSSSYRVLAPGAQASPILRTSLINLRLVICVPAPLNSPFGAMGVCSSGS